MKLLDRNNCDATLRPIQQELIRNLMSEYGLTWEDNIENNDFDEDKIYQFACELLLKAPKEDDLESSVEIKRNPNCKRFLCHKCGCEYFTEVQPQMDEDGIHYWITKCPLCDEENEINDCYWR